MTTVQGRALADQMVTSAVAFAAGKTFGGNTQRTLQALGQGQCSVCDYVRHYLAQQIGRYLGEMDQTVKTVYVFEAAEESGDEAEEVGEATIGERAPGISLIAWVDRKTAALNALAAALEAGLADSRRMLGCVKATPACYSLDVHMVDDADVHERRGYGALIHSLHVRPMQIWARAG